MHDAEKDHFRKTKTFPNLALMKISAYHKAQGDIFVYLLVTSDLDDAMNRVEILKKNKGISIYAQAERNDRQGIKPNSMQREFANRYVYSGKYRTETWDEYCERKHLKMKTMEASK